MRSERLRSTRRSRAGRVTATGVALATLLAPVLQATAPSGAAASVLAPGGYSGGAPGASGNLLAGGDASAGYCTHDWNAASTIPGWTVTQGSPNVMCYPARPVPHPRGPAGDGFFSGGPYGDSAMTQTARLPAAAGRIGAGRSGSGCPAGSAAGGHCPATSGSRWPSSAVPGSGSAAWPGCARSPGPSGAARRCCAAGRTPGRYRPAPVRPGHRGLPGQLDAAGR